MSVIKKIFVFLFIFFVVVIIVLMALWNSGYIGKIIGTKILPSKMPLKINDNFTLMSWTYGSTVVQDQQNITVLVDAKRVDQVIHKILPRYARFIPPGLLKNGLTVAGTLDYEVSECRVSNRLPFKLAINPTQNNRPKVIANLPLDDFEKIIRLKMSDKYEKKEKWIFGSYKEIYEISFDKFNLYSDVEDIQNAPTSRVLYVETSGKVRIKLEDSFIEASTTAGIQNLKAAITLSFEEKKPYVYAGYNVKITDLRLDFKNIAKIGDDYLKDELRKSLEKAVNKDKYKEKVKAFPLPEYFPSDSIVDVRLVR